MGECRLYYDDTGNIVCYTYRDLPGNYIVIDPMTFAECRFDIKVLDGRIIKSKEGTVVTKLIPAIAGIKCSAEDVNIVVADDYLGPTITWKPHKYEFRYN
jgi:hypothetical protein